MRFDKTGNLAVYLAVSGCGCTGSVRSGRLEGVQTCKRYASERLHSSTTLQASDHERARRRHTYRKGLFHPFLQLNLWLRECINLISFIESMQCDNQL